MADDPIIQMQDVKFAYDDEPVLAGVNLAIERRDLVGVIGPNGGGKTTLLKLLLGLIEPSRGKIEIAGKSPHQARRIIGYMPQYAQLDHKFPVSVMDVVLMGRLGKGGGVGPYRGEDKAAAIKALDEVDLAGLRRRPFAALSGGQRQRVLIARALACEPEILLLDEPTANLDPAIQEELYTLFERLSEQFTIIIVSHDLGFVSLTFKTVVCVNRHVHTHPRNELTERQVADMYGREVRLLHPAAHADGRTS